MKVAFRNTMIIISAIILLAFWGLSAFGAITAISNWDTIVDTLTPEPTKEVIIKEKPYEVEVLVTVEGDTEPDFEFDITPDDSGDDSNNSPSRDDTFDDPSDGNDDPDDGLGLNADEVNSPFRGDTLYNTIRDSIVSLKTVTIESAVNVRDDDIKGSVINYYVPEGGNYPGEYKDIQTVAKKLGVTINVTKVSGGYDYILDVQKAIDDGKTVDLFTVDASQWGPVYKYALPVNEIINFSKLGVIENGFRQNMMDSFSMVLSTINNVDTKSYYAMAGYAEPYLLVFDKEVASNEGVDPKGYTASYGQMDATVSAIVATTDEKGNPIVDSEGVCVTKEVSVTGKVATITTIQMDDEFKPIMEDGKYATEVITLNGIIIGNISGRWNHESFADVMQNVTNKENNLYALALPNGDLHRQLIWSIYRIPAFNLNTYKEIRENVVTNSDLNVAFSNFNVYRSLDTEKIGAALLHYIDDSTYQEKLYNFSSSTGVCLGTSANPIHADCTGHDKSYFFWSCMGSDLPEIAKNNENWEFVSWPNGKNVALGKAPQGINATAAYVQAYCIGKNSNEALAAARVAEELTKLRNESHQATLKDTLSEEQMEYYIELKDTAYSSDFNAVTNLINSSDKFTQEEKDTDYDECWFSGNLKGSTERFGYFKKKDEFLLTTVKLMRESYGCYAEKYAVLYKIFDVFSDKYAN